MLRRSFSRLVTFSPVGDVHPDVKWGAAQAQYRGPGWVGWQKTLPMEAMMIQGGSTLTQCSDRVGQIIDPEDPRHPIATFMYGGNSHHDGHVKKMVEGNDFGPVPQSERLLQVLYDSYLEPFSMHRVAVELDDAGKAPNHHEHAMIAHVGQTSALIGSVIVGNGSCIGDNCTLKGDVNAIYIQEGVQILDNVTIVTDRLTKLHYYQRDEDLNPYQSSAPMEGVSVVGMHTIIENNVFIDSAKIGKFNRIGHGSRIMKGVVSDEFVHVLPGSVVTAGTKMNEGELWGGAPAQKLGKVPKMEFKKVFAGANLVRDFTLAVYQGLSETGPQQLERTIKSQQLQHLMVAKEDSVSEVIKKKIEYFTDGREPWCHKISRMTQAWSPPVRGDDRTFMLSPPMSTVHNYMSHNDDSYDSQWIGTRLNFTQYHTEFLW